MKFKKEFLTPVSDKKYLKLKKMVFRNKVSRHFFYKYINENEGGQFYSLTLRRIFREVYDIDAGIGSYGCFTEGFRPHVTIGNYCSVAPGVQRLVGNHPYSFVSTYPLFYKKEWGGVRETRYHEHHLTIGNDVWIGVNAIITGNVKQIGNGSIIGAGAVVTHDVEPYSIVAGVPAHVIGYRFTKDIEEAVEKSSWWELTPDELERYAEFADRPLEFVKQISKVGNGRNTK